MTQHRNATTRDENRYYVSFRVRMCPADPWTRFGVLVSATTKAKALQRARAKLRKERPWLEIEEHGGEVIAGGRREPLEVKATKAVRHG